MTQLWMVRAGEGGHLAVDFDRSGCVAIGWSELGNLSAVTSQDELRRRVDATYPDLKPANRGLSTSTIWKFRDAFRKNDQVLTYYPDRREYLRGAIVGDYEFSPQTIAGHPHLRRVRWESRVSRDALSSGARNVLGSTVAIFKPGLEVMNEVGRLVERASLPAPYGQQDDSGSDKLDLDTLRQQVFGSSHEFIKDKILALNADEMEFLVASLLRAMGYKARVTPKRLDKGRQVIASPDGLNFQRSRIVAKVKHRPKEPTSPEKMGSFLADLLDGEAGLYVSTGGFTKDAEYEAVRAKHPVTLVRLDDLAELVVEHYERFDTEARALIPLVRLYWPT
jgi:restriction system protein